MILRVWQAHARAGRRDAYPEHFRQHVVPELRGVAGFLGATLSSRDVDGVVEFTVVTRWASMEAIRAFAGDDAHRAVVAPDAVATLIDYERTVRHLTVLEQIDSGG